MPTGHNPVAAHPDSDQVIEIKSDNSRATTSRAPKYYCPVCAPFKVAAPSLQTWVEQCHWPTRQRIAAAHLHALEKITGVTCQPKIGVVIRSTSRERDNVLDFQRPWHIVLMGQAVSATVASVLSYACSLSLRDAIVLTNALPAEAHAEPPQPTPQLDASNTVDTTPPAPSILAARQMIMRLLNAVQKADLAAGHALEAFASQLMPRPPHHSVRKPVSYTHLTLPTNREV